MLAGNMGARERMQFTVIGETVNLASKLCGISRPGDVVVTSELASHPELQDRIFTESHKPLVIAGSFDTINTSRITQIASSRSILIDNQLYSILNNQAAA
jgi:adenylate cyclase